MSQPPLTPDRWMSYYHKILRFFLSITLNFCYIPVPTPIMFERGTSRHGCCVAYAVTRPYSTRYVYYK